MLPYSEMNDFTLYIGPSITDQKIRVNKKGLFCSIF